MDNGNGPPASIEISQNMDGNYYLSWSGLNRYPYVKSRFVTSREVLRSFGRQRETQDRTKHNKKFLLNRFDLCNEN